jgi:hypothetical protein
VAALLKKELGVDVETIGGKTGEFSISVDGKVVAKKGWFKFPTDTTVLEAVRKELAA